MIDTRVNPNLVYIPVVRSGCFGFKVASTYPVQLNGVINNDEFRESIKKINQAGSLRGRLKLWLYISVLIAISGTALFTIATKVDFGPGQTYPSILVVVGLVISLFGWCSSMCSCATSRSRRLRQIEEAINEESTKYSSRSPIRCGWTLKAIKSSARGNGNPPARLLGYCLVINIDRSMRSRSRPCSLNQAINESALLFGQQEADPPPPYPGPTAKFCSECGAARQDLSAEICTSCGQSFNRY